MPKPKAKAKQTDDATNPRGKRTRTRDQASAAGAIAAGGFAGAVVAVGIWAAKQFWSIDVPATLAAPLTTIVSGVGSALYIAGSWLLQRWSA